MESFVKYEKFVLSDQPELKKPRSKWLIVLAGVCVALLVVCVLAIGFGVGFSVTTGETGLKDVTITDDELQGEYHTTNGGIHFQSMINATHIYFSISTTNGDAVVMIVRPLATSMTMMAVNNTDFLMIKEEDGEESEYLIPKEHRDTMRSVLMGQVNIADEMLQDLDTETVATVRESTLQNFVVSPEALLVIDAAKALGNRGIMGTDSQAVLKFYMFAMQLSNNRDRMTDSYSDANPSRGLKTRKRAAYQCNRAQCDRCPYNYNLDKTGYENECFGLCGTGCSCWSWVCGDCCLHKYCETHDACCAQKGFYTLTCFSAAYDFFSSCTDTFSC